MASTGGSQYGTAALQALRDVPGLDRHHLEQAGFLAGVRPGHANDGDGMCDTSNPLGCNKHVRSPKG